MNATPPLTAGAFVAKKLRELDVALAATIPRVVASADDEAIHDLRVAIRRLRTLLKMSRGLFGRWHVDVVRGVFTEMHRSTGELRDEEVLEETVGPLFEDAEGAAWLVHRKKLEAKLRRSVLRKIEHGVLDRARLMLKALLVFPVEPDRDQDLSKFARRTVERARRRVEKKREVSPDDVLGLHDLRIAYKELRYAIEMLGEALPLDDRALLEPATVFQKRLGELHDADVALDVVAGDDKLSHHARTRSLDALRQLRAKRLAKYLRELDPLAADRAATDPSDRSAGEKSAGPGDPGDA